MGLGRGTYLSHPKGVLLLACTGFWERFSYYGTQSLLVLFLIDQTRTGGFGWAKDDSLRLFGLYAGFIWLAPLLGGWVADRFLGARRAVALGCLIMALGHFCLAGPALIPKAVESATGYPVAEVQPAAEIAQGKLLALDDVRTAIAASVQRAGSVSQDDMAGAVRAVELSYVLSGASFFCALGLLILGSGLFTGNVTVIVGQLYGSGDERRDAGFTIFWVGINAGALFAPIVAGTMGERVGWHYGFTVAGFGMLLGLAIYLRLQRRLLAGAGERVRRTADSSSARLSREERVRIRFVLLMCAFATVFWSAYMQFGGLINLYAQEHTERSLFGFVVPATWFLSINPIGIVVLGPVAVAVWAAFARAGRPVPTPTKFTAGLVLLGIAYLVMVAAAAQMTAEPDQRSHLLWLVGFHLILTLAELCLAPVGLAMVSRLAPVRLAGLFMGVWLLTLALGNFIAGNVGAFSEHVGLAATFGSLAAALFAAAVVLRISAGKLSTYFVDEERASSARPAGAALQAPQSRIQA